MDKTYLFYDLETTGLNKCFDQMLQFAAIRTDLDLNEITRNEIRIKLSPHIIPSPAALIAHKISVAEMLHGMCEYEAVAKIHELLNSPGTISAGYNNLSFDDEFLRFAFYRNLFTPYTHQYKNGCGRMDIYPITVMFYLYQKNALHWSKKRGKNSFKLEDLNAANKLTVGAAHNAIFDTETTLALAKKFKSHVDKWQYLTKSFSKDFDLKKMAKLDRGLLIDGSFGQENNYQTYALKLGTHNHYRNQVLWLRIDDEQLTSTTSATIIETTKIVRKKAGENFLLLPAEDKFMRHFPQEKISLIKNNLTWLETNKAIYKEIKNYHQEYTYPKIANIDIDAALYQNGFLDDAEITLCAQFHNASPQKKAEIIESFYNHNLREQAIRVLARNYKEYTPKKYLASYNEAPKLVDYKNQPKFTLADAQREIIELKAAGELDGKQLQLLDEFSAYFGCDKRD